MSDNYWIQTLVSMVSLMEHQKHSVDLVLLETDTALAHPAVIHFLTEWYVRPYCAIKRLA